MHRRLEFIGTARDGVPIVTLHAVCILANQHAAQAMSGAGIAANKTMAIPIPRIPCCVPICAPSELTIRASTSSPADSHWQPPAEPPQDPKAMDDTCPVRPAVAACKSASAKPQKGSSSVNRAIFLAAVTVSLIAPTLLSVVLAVPRRCKWTVMPTILIELQRFKFALAHLPPALPQH